MNGIIDIVSHTRQYYKNVSVSDLPQPLLNTHILREQYIHMYINDPSLANKRVKAVKQAKESDVPKGEEFRHVRDNYGGFEGNMLEATIENVFED